MAENEDKQKAHYKGTMEVIPADCVTAIFPEDRVRKPLSLIRRASLIQNISRF